VEGEIGDTFCYSFSGNTLKQVIVVSPVPVSAEPIPREARALPHVPVFALQGTGPYIFLRCFAGRIWVPGGIHS